MREIVEIENIEEMRLREGIYDVELRAEIRALRPGDFVRLTFHDSKHSGAGETLLVRITSIRGDDLRGKLAEEPYSAALAALRTGTILTFTSRHIHSLPKMPQPHG